MGGTAGAAAGAAARARKRLVSHFMAANAVSATAAVAYEPHRGMERRWLEHLIDKGVLHRGKAGSYWIDIPAYEKWSRSRRQRLGAIVGAAVAVSAALGFLVGGA